MPLVRRGIRLAHDREWFPIFDPTALNTPRAIQHVIIVSCDDSLQQWLYDGGTLILPCGEYFVGIRAAARLNAGEWYGTIAYGNRGFVQSTLNREPGPDISD